MNTEVVDAEVVEETALAVQETQVNLFRATEPTDVIDHAVAVAEKVRPLIVARGWAKKFGGNREHVEIQGWQTIGGMVGVHAIVTRTDRITDDKGNAGWEAHAEAKTMSGIVVGAADSQCSRSEQNWKSSDDYSLRSMAQTRACSRALQSPLRWVMELAGFAGTPAEEMAHDFSKAQPEGHECPKCAAPVWDNSQDPDRGKRPIWKCKDKNCDWASWNEDEFSPGAAEPPSTGTADDTQAVEPAPGEPLWLKALLKAYSEQQVIDAAESVRAELGTGSPITGLSGVSGANEEIQAAIAAKLASDDWGASAKAGAAK